MKTLKIISLGFMIVGLIGSFSCSTTKEISENNPPFKVLKSTYSKWNGGQPGVNGMLVSIEIDNSKIELDSIYFRNIAIKLKQNKSTTNILYEGSFVLPNKNLILDIDQKKEYGNPVPDVSQKIPFQLNKNEAVVSYSYNKRKNYYKITNLVEVENSVKEH